MSEFLAAILSVKGMSSEITIVLSFSALLIFFIFKRKDIDITSATSIGKLQNEQLTILINQNQILSKSLIDMRNDMSKKMDEHFLIVSELRTRISELEDLVRHNDRNSCDICDHRKRSNIF
jgi:hypothetical protein